MLLKGEVGFGDCRLEGGILGIQHTEYEVVGFLGGFNKQLSTYLGGWG
jgi:hypothetical protein